MSRSSKNNQINNQSDDKFNNEIECDKESISSTTTTSTVSWLLHSAWSVPKSMGDYLWSSIKGGTSIGGDGISDGSIAGISSRSNISCHSSINSHSPSPSLPSSDLEISNNHNDESNPSSSNFTSGTFREFKKKTKIPPSNVSYLDNQDFGIKLIERHAQDPNDHLVTNVMMAKLHTALSSKWRLATTWKLLYSTTEYGFSLGTLYSQSRIHHSSSTHQYHNFHHSPFGTGGESSGIGSIGTRKNGEREERKNGIASDGIRDQNRSNLMASGSIGSSPSVMNSSVSHSSSPQLLCIKDENDNLFGLMASEALRPHPGPYGSIDCFLWKLEPHTGRIKKYASTGKNNCYLLSEKDFMAAGCSNGKFGLWLDEELLNGTSAFVTTFDNEPLIEGENVKTLEEKKEKSFQCISLELWGLEIQ